MPPNVLIPPTGGGIPSPPPNHATEHENGGGDEISVAGLSGLLADAQTPLAHDIDDHTFPGGTSDFLRADGTFAAPPAGGSPPTGTGFRHITGGAEDAAAKLVDTADINDNQVTPAKLDDGSGFSVLGKPTTGSGDRSDIVGGANTVLGRDGSGDLAFAAIVAGQIAANAIGNSRLAQMAQGTLKGRAAGAGTGDPTDRTLAQVLSDLAAFSGVTLQAFTATGANTYTPTSGMKWCIAISTGAGGGGGGADVTGAADAGAGAGGGAGGTCIEAFSAATIGVSQTVTIGTGGTAGNNTGGNGGNGGNTTFGALHTANGGTGGAGSGAASTANHRAVAGGAGGTPSGGLVNMPGGTGHDGWSMLSIDATDASEGAIAMGGSGGASMWGGGGRGGSNAQDGAAGDSTAGSQAGSNGAARGSGAGGGAVNNTATGVAGGVGADGFCLVIEFT